MVTARNLNQRIGIPTPRVLALEAVQQSINNIRERIAGVERIVDRLSTQAAGTTTTQAITVLQGQLRALQDQVNQFVAGSDALTQLILDPDGLVVLKDGVLLTRVLVPGANITITNPDGVAGDIVIASTGGGGRPLTTGEEPLVLVSDGSGQCVMVPT